MNAEMHRRLEVKLQNDVNACDSLPYVCWNTCPICCCGLVPVLVAVVSAVFGLDFAIYVTDIGAQVASDIGISYTVYYTAGCWPVQSASTTSNTTPTWLSKRPPSRPCTAGSFEIGAAQFDAFSGTVLGAKNITSLSAKSIDAVKVTPDWKYVTFIGELALGLNIWMVGAEQESTATANPVLSAGQLESLDAHCIGSSHRLAGLRHLHLIEGRYGLDVLGDNGLFKRSNTSYRAAFTFVCCSEGGVFASANCSVPQASKFNQIAVVDFNVTRNGVHNYSVKSGLHIARMPDNFTYASQSCPRFVPSKGGTELLFIAEEGAQVAHSAAAVNGGAASRLATMSVPKAMTAGLEVAEPPEPTPTFRRLEDTVVEGVVHTFTDQPTLFAVQGENTGLLPYTSFRGCPEFLPRYQSFVSTDVWKAPEDWAKAQNAEDEDVPRDAFVIISVPTSLSVIGIEGQVLKVTMNNDTASTGQLASVENQYNVDTVPPSFGLGASTGALKIAGCQPIQAAGRQGHMGYQRIVERLQALLSISSERQRFNEWLACLTVDQRVAIVESPKQDQWINMTMPYPIRTGLPEQSVWCPQDRAEACFEVWSNPNPND